MSVDDSAPHDAPATGVGLLEEWFVRYNPFYVASACLTVAGARQLSLGIAERGWDDGSVLPTCVLALYQLLLALACAAVARTGMTRPAVMLALVGTLFVVDPTFQSDRIAFDASRAIGLVGALGSLMLVGLVTRILSRALNIEFGRSFRALLFLTVGGITAGPQLLHSDVLSLPDAYLLLVLWGVTIVVVAVRLPIHIEIRRGSEEWAEKVARRASIYLTFLFPVACLVHLKGWFDVFEPSLDWRTPLVLAFAFIVAARSEQVVWLGGLAAFAIGMSHPEHASGAILLVAVLLLVRWRLGLSYRLAIGALGALWTAIVLWQWTGGTFPDAPSWLTLLVAAGLVGLAIHRRSFLPLIPIPFMARATAWGIGEVGPMVRGIVLLASGFLLLAAGVVANLYAERSRVGPRT
jgi:hypothetical protein